MGTMKRVWFIKVLYYLFFTIIFVVALIIFFETTNFSFYNEHLGDFFQKVFDMLNF